MNDDFRIVFLPAPPDESKDDNVDVQVHLGDGRRFSATIFTVDAIKRLMEKDRSTGECLGGQYFWCVDAIIVERLDVDLVGRVVADLLRSNSIASAMQLIGSGDALKPADLKMD